MSQFQFRAGDLSAQRSLPADARFRDWQGSEPEVGALCLVSGANSPPSTALSSRSPTPESPYGDHLVDIYLDRLGIRKPMFSRNIDLQGEQRRHINDLPLDVLVPIVSYLESTRDLLAFMLVQRRWHLLAASRVWYKPIVESEAALRKITTCLNAADSGSLYQDLIHRLNLAPAANYLTNEGLASFLLCSNMNRLVLSGCRSITAASIEQLLSRMPRIQSLDLHGVPQITDDTMLCIASNLKGLQVFHGGGTSVSDRGLLHLKALNQSLRRLVLSHCDHTSASALAELASQCTQLIELDATAMACFTGDYINLTLLTAQIENGSEDGSVASAISAGLSNDDAQLLLANCTNLRDLRLDGSSALSAEGFYLSSMRLVPPRLDALRVLSLSMCTQLNDTAIAQLVRIAPRVRHLNISKCPLITDKAVGLIAHAYNLGLHYLHLGHCIKITDCSVAFLVESCTRLAFFDAANCTNLTDASLAFLAKLPRLRRIGVVKCNEIGAAGVMALSIRPDGCENGSPIERLHLSYCSSISIRSIKLVLDACPRLVHLSLTGVVAFMQTEIMQHSRRPPPELNEYQRQVFCVFSGPGIGHLRDVLARILNPESSSFGARISGMLADSNIPSVVVPPPVPHPRSGLSRFDSPPVGNPSVGNPPVDNPPASNPSAGNPWARNQSAGIPSAGIPSAGTPSAGIPSAGNPSARNPSAGNPSAGNPSAGRAPGGMNLPPPESLDWRQLQHSQRLAFENSWRSQFVAWQGRANNPWSELGHVAVARSQPSGSVFDTPRAQSSTPPNGPLEGP